MRNEHTPPRGQGVSLADKVVAVISVYRAPADLRDRVVSLLQQVDGVIVVDDGSHSVDEMGHLSKVATVISADENRGIAAALNTGIAKAVADGATWILTMDQDSRLCSDYVKSALSSWKDAADAGLEPGLVSAASHNGTAVPTWAGSNNQPQLFDPMQSGTLLAVEILAKTGLFDESLFIDCVDTDYNIRLKQAGYSLVPGVGCDLQHALGDARPLRVLGWQPKLRGKPLEILYHAPFRTYYITRNNTILRKRYGRAMGAWMLRRQMMEIESVIICLVYGPERRKHLMAMWRGWLDAHRGRTGRIPEVLARRLG